MEEAHWPIQFEHFRFFQCGPRCDALGKSLLRYHLLVHKFAYIMKRKLEKSFKNSTWSALRKQNVHIPA